MPLPIADALPTPCLTNNMNPVARKKIKGRISESQGL